jgi:hypothetical protein
MFGSRREAAVYIRDLSAELSGIAAAYDLETLAVLLAVTQREAHEAIEAEAQAH